MNIRELGELAYGGSQNGLADVISTKPFRVCLTDLGSK